MEIVNHMIKRVDENKFQIAVPLRHFILNLPDNILQAKNRLNKQRESLKQKSDLIPKFCEKSKWLKTEGYTKKVDPVQTPISGQVWYVPHFSMQQAKFRVVYDDLRNSVEPLSTE